MPNEQTKIFEKLDVYYDGLCPFCADISKKSSLSRLAHNVELHDLRKRSSPQLDSHYNFNKGMLIIADGKHYFGCHAVYLMSVAGYKSIFWSSLGWALKLRTLACMLYPFFRIIRRVTLIALGRSKPL